MNQTAVNAMKRWKVNAVRVPLNEACWNGDSYQPGLPGQRLPGGPSRSM